MRVVVCVCVRLSLQGAVDSAAALRLGFACLEDGAQGLWQPAPAAEEEPGKGPE